MCAQVNAQGAPNPVGGSPGPVAAQSSIGDRKGTVEIYSGQEFAAALADPGVQVAVVPLDIVLSAADWATYSAPVLLTRNFTVTGAFEERERWPTLDLAFVRAQVQQGPGTVLEFRRLVVPRYRSPPQFQAPGLDLLWSSNLSSGFGAPNPLTPLVIVRDAAIVHRICLPEGQVVLSISSLARPLEVPGRNQRESLPPPPGCLNGSTAPPMQRCWLAMGLYKDSAMYGTDIDVYGNPVRTGYIVWLLDTIYLCDVVMDDACIDGLGPVGCFWQTAASLSSSEGTPPGNQGALPPASPSVALTSPEPKRASKVVPLVAGLVSGSVVIVALLALAFVLMRKHTVPCSTDEEPRAANHGGTEPCVVASGTGHQGGQHLRYVLHEAPARGITEQRVFNDLGFEAAPGVRLESGRFCAAEVQLIPVTLLTPVSPGVNLRLKLANTTPNDGTHYGSDEVELLGKVLGRGATGRVVMGRYRGELVAVKMINAGLAEKGPQPAALGIGDKLTPSGGGDADGGGADRQQQQQQQREAGVMAGQSGTMSQLERQTLAQEVEVLARCQHPNIVRLLAANLEPSRVCLVTELMETSLERVLHGGGAENGGRLLPLSTVLHISTQIARALAYLHPTILHRDLKPGNVLISQAASSEPVAKLADFGLSRIRVTTLQTCNPEVGTVPYMAPETFDVTNYFITDRADVYSFGVLLWEMLTGKRPWDDTTDVQVAVAVALRNTRLSLGEALLPVSRCPPKLRALIRACWEKDPARRPAAAEIVKALALVQEGLSTSIVENSDP